MRILCVGMNHKTADVALREKLSFDAGQVRHALGELGDKWAEAEFVVVSTCNRTELYMARPVHGHPREEELREWLAAFHALKLDDIAPALYTLADTEAIRHLFTVAAGLDSLVPGEGQIVAQLKDAYAAGVEARAARTVMNDLFQMALHVAKHIRTETGIGAGKVSVASAAIEFVCQIFESLRGKCVLNVGAGKMNQLMLKQLSELGAGRIVVVNRSPDKAEALARACGGQARPLAELGDSLAQADIVLTSTGSESPIITRKMVQAAQDRRRWRPLLIVDIAVPRDVQADVGELENVFLYNIDDLERIVRSTIQMRHGQRDAAAKIVDRHVEEHSGSFNVRNVAPTIDALYRTMERIAAEELAAARSKLTTHQDADADAEILQRALHRTIRRILHPCAQNLRRSAGSDSAKAYVSSIRHLFDLDKEDQAD